MLSLFIPHEEYDPEETEYVLNLRKLCDLAISQYEAGSENEFDFGQYGVMKVDDDHDIFFKEITITYNEDEPEKMTISFSGYVLER